MKLKLLLILLIFPLISFAQNAVKHGKADKINVSLQEYNDQQKIKIFNNGDHINNNILEKIFDENVKYGKNSGSGMGLYLVKQNVQRYGGSIYAENTEPAGVTFMINLKKA